MDQIPLCDVATAYIALQVHFTSGEMERKTMFFYCQTRNTIIIYRMHLAIKENVCWYSIGIVNINIGHMCIWSKWKIKWFRIKTELND